MRGILKYRLLIAAGALLIAGLACDMPGSAPAGTPTALSPEETPTEVVTEAPTLPGEPCQPPAPDASIADGASWEVYCSEIYGFAFRYPAGGFPPSIEPGHANIPLPFTAGTNLTDKYIAVTMIEGATTCESPNAQGAPAGTFPSETAAFNGIDFYKQTGSDAGAGQFYDWVGYSSLNGELCVSVTFIMHSNSPGVFETPPPEFDKAAESAVFDQIMATFYFFTPIAGQGPEPIPTAEGSTAGSTGCEPPEPDGPSANLVISVYCDTVNGFGFRYAPVGDSGYSGAGPLNLPINTPGTNLADKYLEISVIDGATTCQSPQAAGYEPGSIPTDTATINGIDFVHEIASNSGAGNNYRWEGFSTLQGSKCISMTFILHSLNPSNFPTPPPEFDLSNETGIFETIMSTFVWFGS